MTTIGKTFDQTFTTGHAWTAAIRRVAGAASRAVTAVMRAVAGRWEVRGLLELDERALRDVGLLRNDVLGALSEPIYRDPSAILTVRAVDRRVRARAIAAAIDRAAAKASKTRG